VQECYLRALRHFDSFRGPAMKPWLLAILKNVCNSEFMQRRRREVPTDYAQDESAAEAMPMWQEPQASPEKVMQQQDSARIWRLVAELPEPFREAIMLREVNDLSYKEIARLAGVQVGTVMSRLARALDVAHRMEPSAEVAGVKSQIDLYVLCRMRTKHDAATSR
jgi:RNA polymerase sigma-70 factor, ECF subfamily